MSAALPQPLHFRLGARSLFSVKRRLVRVGLSLERSLAARQVALPKLDESDDGYLVTSLPEGQRDAIAERRPDLMVLVRQRYARRYADLTLGFDEYMAQLSAKSRSTLRRKLRRFASLSGGTIDVRCYREPEEMAEFYRLARQVSETTYQERLLDAGLPEGRVAEAEMKRLARHDRVRGWLLFLEGEPIAYLYAPADGDTLIYAHLGYDPAHAPHSPGTVLQLEAMRMLMEEGRFARFDFTEGDGQHKRQFGTGSVECADLLLLRKSLANDLLAGALLAFDAAVSAGKLAVNLLGLDRLAAKLRR